MATVLEPKPDANQEFSTQVDEQMAQARARIRTHDALVGGLVLASLLTLYALGMILLDKSLNLPDAARQGSLIGFAAVFAAVAYFVLIRPLRRPINPLYAALKVEKTIEDAKNSVAGYVELKEQNLNPHVRTALGARAVQAMNEADMNRAVDHRSLVYLGSAFAVTLLGLIVLFFLFRPTQFLSLLERAFNPFAITAIASRTQITIFQPEGGDATVTVGQPLLLAVQVSGKVPGENAPDRLRLLLRYNPANPSYEEFPLERGENKHEWSLQIPPHQVQNGFWYKVAGGDGETAEHRVSVRSLPHFMRFRTDYEYPAYLRMTPESVADSLSPDLFGYRGTKVTLTAFANRPVREGRMEVQFRTDVPPLTVTGETVSGEPNALRFALTLQDAGTFRLSYTAVNGERSLPTNPYQIEILSDQPPRVEITRPQGEEIPLPLNGQLAIDAALADDFGLASATLRMRLAGEKPLPLAAKPFQNGKALRRISDGTFPTSFDYKDSVDLAQLKDETGQAVTLTEGAILEYWLEAADNQEPKPNLGKSRVQRVRVRAATPNPQQVQDEKAQRRQEEQAHQQGQQQRLDNEPRAPKPGPRQKPEAQPPADQPPAENGGEAGGEAQPGKAGQPDAGEGQKGKPGADGAQPSPTEGGKTPMGTPPADKGTPPGEAQPQPGEAQPPPGKSGEQAGDEQLRNEAEKIQDAIRQQQESAGEAKPGADSAPQADASQPKPMPGETNEPSAAQKDTTPPAGTPGAGSKDSSPDAAQSKPEGQVEPPPAPGEDKTPPPPKEASPDSSRQGEPEKGANGQEKPQPAGEAKSEPVGSPAGTDKETPPEPKDSNAKNEPSSAGEGKPSSKQEKGSEPQQGQPQGGNETAGGEAKKPSEPSRGHGKESGEAKTPMNQEGSADTQAGRGKSDQAPEPGRQKSPPQEGASPEGQGEEKGSPPDSQGENGDAASGKPAGGSGAGQPSQGQPPPSKGDSKPSDPGELARERGRKSQESNPDAQGKMQPKDGPEELVRNKDRFRDTARDLNSPDDNRRKNAEEQMEQAIGKEGRQDAQNAARGLDSPDKQEQQKAEDDLDQLRKKKKPEAVAQSGGKDQQGEPKGNEGQGQKRPAKEDVDELAKKAKDLNSSDPNAREQAEKDLDQRIGKQNREAVQEAMKKAGDGAAGKEQAAREKLDELAKKPPAGNDRGADSQPPTKEQVEQLAKDAQDLASKDEAKRQAAEKKLDEQIGREQREKLQSAMKEAQDNPEEAKRKLEQMAKELADKQKDGKPGLSPEEQQDLRKKVEDLASADDAKRAEAEKAFDEKLGKDQREALQKSLKDRKAGEPNDNKPSEQALEDARKKLEDMAQNSGSNRDPQGNPAPGGASGTDNPPNVAAEADPKNRLKSAELQLEQFKDKQFDREFLKSIGKNEEEYRDFLRGYEQMVERMRAEAAAPAAVAEKVAPPPAPTINVGGGGVVEARKGNDGAGVSGGPAYAPPGFSDAKERFGREILQQKPMPR